MQLQDGILLHPNISGTNMCSIEAAIPTQPQKQCSHTIQHGPTYLLSIYHSPAHDIERRLRTRCQDAQHKDDYLSQKDATHVVIVG